MNEKYSFVKYDEWTWTKTKTWEANEANSCFLYVTFISCFTFGVFVPCTDIIALRFLVFVLIQFASKVLGDKQ